ncbi:hypothetical protein B0H10DRAFT_1950761 [Mycena sp. CBHHK59/15]|nr:hypothetical protein B0H10DRAFT_1950761 [Mycena sp. CBHHK59/15]
MAPITPLTKTIAANRARRQANRAGSTPADAPSDGVTAPNNTIAALRTQTPPLYRPRTLPRLCRPLSPPTTQSCLPPPPSTRRPTGTILASAAPDVLAIGETCMSVIDVDPSPRPDTMRRDDFPPLPSPGNETMTPVSHAEKRKGKGKGKAKETGVFTMHAPQNQLNMISSQSPGVRSRRRPGGPHMYKLPHPPAPAPRRRSSEPHPRNHHVARFSHPCRQRRIVLSQLPPSLLPTLANTTLAAAIAPSSPSPPPPAAPANEPEAHRRRADDEGHTIPPLTPLAPTTAWWTASRRVAPTCRPPCTAIVPLWWDGAPHPKRLCWISGDNGDRLQMAPRLQTHIANRLNMNPADVRVGAPGLREGPGPDPIAWLISMPEEQAQVLLDMGALNSDDSLLTFYVPYAPPITPFLCTLAGLTIPEADAELVLAIIGEAIAGDNDIARFVRGDRDTFPAHVTADEAHARFTESVYVIALPLRSVRGAFIAWNVYVRAPTNNEDTFAELQALVGRLVIPTIYSGEGRLHRAMYCHICCSVDHSTNICPITSLPGYMGATAETIGALKEASREVLNTSRPGKFQQGKNNNTKGNGKGKGKDREDRGGKGGNNRRK